MFRLLSMVLGGCSMIVGSCVAVADGSDHWAFQPVRRPAIPGNDAALTPIDAFVRSRLATEHLAPSPPAPPLTLLRRLHLDLTGLLPDWAECEAFAADWQRDPEATYAAKVRQLLDSPHFGERWARHWLDMARYADSDGYLGDDLRPWAYVYRDWVVEAINHDLPFDQFSIEQLAGDLLPDATQSQKIATGFHRNCLRNTEAGADRELDRTKQVVDRVATTGAIWLGLTLGCAECHDHKHDPIAQREFYRLYAFFNNTEDAEVPVRFEPEWNAWEAKHLSWETQLLDLERALAEHPPQHQPPPEPVGEWTFLKPDTATAAGLELAVADDATINVSGKNPPAITYLLEKQLTAPLVATAFRLEALGTFGTGRELGTPCGRGEDGAFALSWILAEVEVPGAKPRRLVFHHAVADQHDGQALEKVLDPGTSEGWQVTRRTRQPHAAIFTLAEPESIPAGSRIKFSLAQKLGTGQTLGRFRLSFTGASGSLNPGVPRIDPEWADRRLALERHLALTPPKPATKAQTLTERTSDLRPTHLHIRGDYARTGEAVTPGTPAVLHPFPTSEQPNRLSLARWLFDAANPLTARVAVNRIWQHLFGEGLVTSTDDFGTHGAPPSHPELLDWLASEYRRLGWSRKELIHTIVMSQTYRQSSDNHRPNLSNQLLWRQNSFRCSAETVRDLHLGASGLLSAKLGGPAVFPPLPEFVTEVGRSVKWPESQGADRYRRGLYIFLKRTVLYPMLTTFDAPDTSSACTRRERTNTPMQALTLLNDPVFFECSETLGRKVSTRHADDLSGALHELVHHCLNREATPAEMDTLTAAHRDFLAASSDATLAMTATARIVLNLDEFITRD